jgi:hypothetical protein
MRYLPHGVFRARNLGIGRHASPVVRILKRKLNTRETFTECGLPVWSILYLALAEAVQDGRGEGRC